MYYNLMVLSYLSEYHRPHGLSSQDLLPVEIRKWSPIVATKGGELWQQ